MRGQNRSLHIKLSRQNRELKYIASAHCVEIRIGPSQYWLKVCEPSFITALTSENNKGEEKYIFLSSYLPIQDMYSNKVFDPVATETIHSAIAFNLLKARVQIVGIFASLLIG